jgi:hypothetical protein
MEQARVIGEQEFASLRGKMQFSNAQVYGRIGARAFHVLNKATQPIPGYAWRGSEVEEAIRWWIQTVDRMPPRTLDHKDRRLPVRIFTDGACEGEASESTTYGAVLFDPEDGSVEAFGAEMCEELKSLLSEEGKKTQLITQAEILPMVVSRIIWSPKLLGRDILHYVDNEGSRLSTIKGNSPSRQSAWLIHAFWETEVMNRSRSWLSRVPTECNIGDGPSRGDWEELRDLYPRCIRREWSQEQEKALMRRWGVA